MKAIVIDNESEVRSTFVQLLKQFCPELNTIEEAKGIDDGLALIKGSKPDLVFLDVELDGNTGFDLLQRLNEITFQLVFITAHNKYAVDAFKMSALDFLVKPVDPELLINAVNKAKNQIELSNLNERIKNLLQSFSQVNQSEKIVLKDSSSIYFVKLKDIIRCEAQGAYTTFFLAKGERIVISKTIKEYDELLTPKGFLRVHQSHLVQIAMIKKFDRSSETLFLDNNDLIPVSQRKKEVVLEALNK